MLVFVIQTTYETHLFVLLTIKMLSKAFIQYRFLLIRYFIWWFHWNYSSTFIFLCSTFWTTEMNRRNCYYLSLQSGWASECSCSLIIFIWLRSSALRLSMYRKRGLQEWKRTSFVNKTDFEVMVSGDVIWHMYLLYIYCKEN